MIDREARVRQLLAFDAEYRAGGLVVAGIDEVGRGPLAGNVVTACVILPPEPVILWIDDSKKLSESRREKVFHEIDRINILQATRKAMQMAAAQVRADVFLIDAVRSLGLNGREVSIIKGDASSYSIAAASIVAKVIRDRQMAELDQLYPEYGFARNKGYGTKEHIEALKHIGPCPEHRRSFIGHFI